MVKLAVYQLLIVALTLLSSFKCEKHFQEDDTEKWAQDDTENWAQDDTEESKQDDTEKWAQDDAEETTTVLATDVYRGYQMLPGGWVNPFNGYKYIMTTTARTQAAARADCKALGGDLAVVGMQDLGTRRTILRALPKKPSWFGATLNEGNNNSKWYWITGQEVSIANIFWIPTITMYRGQISIWNGHVENCVQTSTPSDTNFPLTNDLSCTLHKLVGLCEKKM